MINVNRYKDIDINKDIKYLSPGKVRAPALPPSTAVVTPL